MTWLLPWLAAAALAQEELRVGLFVGNNDGGPSDQPLLFAVRDARKMRDLFVEHGGVAPSDAVLLEDGSRRAVESALQGLRAKLAAAGAEGRPTTLIFYYSGHGDDVALHLGPTSLAHDELRAWLDGSGAGVRLGMIDACQSGAAVRSKGGQRGPSFAFAVDVQATKGTALLTSSAASEVSQESSEVGGGFFTHYLHTALLGAADLDRNGEVDLGEASRYVHGETAFGTHGAPSSQTPMYDFDLVGSGDIVLTTLEAANAHLTFLGDLDGTYAVWDDGRKRYVAEVDGDHALSLALRPGTYHVHRRMPGWVDEARYTVRRGETLSIFEEDFESVAYEDTAARGELERQARRARMPDLSLRVLIGGRGFGESTYGREFLPAHPIGGFEARFLRSRTSWFGFDVLTGAGRGEVELPEIGPLAVNVTSTSFGASAGVATRPWPLRAGIGANVEVIGFTRTFPDGADERQASLSLAFGPTAWVGLHVGRFSWDFQIDVLTMPTPWAEDEGWPVFAEVLPFSFGVRF